MINKKKIGIAPKKSIVRSRTAVLSKPVTIFKRESSSLKACANHKLALFNIGPPIF